MFKIPKCQICKKELDKDTAFKITKGKVNKYYCNEEEYNAVQKAKKIKDNTYEKIYECFGRKVTNSILYKEIGEIEKVYGFSKINAYISENVSYLSSVMNKDFSSEFAQIRYFTAILKNSLFDFTVDDLPTKQVNFEIVDMKYKAQGHKRTLEEIEQGVGD